jgi:signal transduction histidine kinase
MAVFAAGTMVAGVWAFAAIAGLVSAPAPVLAVGIAALALVTLGAVQAARAVRRLAEPVDDLIGAAARIESGDYSGCVAERGPRDVRSLIRAFNDMSERLQAADASRRSFLADMAHEMRTPLSVIQGQLEAIADGVYPADEAHLAPVVDQVRTLERLVDDLRTVALAEAGALELRIEPVDLGALVDDVVAVMRPSAAGVELATAIEPDLPPVPADAARLRQVVSNLLANAIRHTPPGGRIDVAVESAPDGRVAVSVRDTGPGIPEEILPTVFDRFVKGQDAVGTGLGLAIARDLVQAHGGSITAGGGSGEGATIRLTLPLESRG